MAGLTDMAAQRMSGTFRAPVPQEWKIAGMSGGELVLPWRTLDWDFKATWPPGKLFVESATMDGMLGWDTQDFMRYYLLDTTATVRREDTLTLTVTTDIHHA